MQVAQIYTRSPLRNFNYIIHDGSEAICVDPFDGKKIAAQLHAMGLRLKAIINTHAHYDHICGNEALKAAPHVAADTPIWCHPDADIPNIDARLLDGQQIAFGDADQQNSIKVLDTPGHTMSHLCLLVIKAGKPVALVAGDCIFNGGIGNCRNGGHPSAMYETVRNVILQLPEDIIVYPGHDYLANNLEFTLSIDPDLDEARELLSQYPQSETEFIAADLGLEKRISLFFRSHEPRLQRLVAKAAGLEDTEPFGCREAFLALRQLRDRW